MAIKQIFTQCSAIIVILYLFFSQIWGKQTTQKYATKGSDSIVHVHTLRVYPFLTATAELDQDHQIFEGSSKQILTLQQFVGRNEIS